MTAMYRRIVVHAGEEQQVRLLTSRLRPLHYGGKEYHRVHEQDDWVVAELMDGDEPPLTPSLDGADPCWAVRAGLVAAVRQARLDQRAAYHVVRMCMHRPPERLDCFTAYRAETAVRTDALACALLGAPDGGATAAYRTWRDAGYVAALKSAIQSLDMKSINDGCKKACVDTAALMAILRNATPIGWATTGAEASFILKHTAKVAILRALKRLAGAKDDATMARAVQAFIYFAAAHCEVNEGSPFVGVPADAGELSTAAEVVAFCDAHNACVAALTADPTASRSSKPYTLGGAPVVFAAAPSERAGSRAPAHMLNRLRNLRGEPSIDRLVAPAVLSMDMGVLANWAMGRVKPAAPAGASDHDPGKQDVHKEYTYEGGFIISTSDCIQFTVGGVTADACAVLDAHGRIHSDNGYRVYVWTNKVAAGAGQMINLDSCTEFNMTLGNKAEKYKLLDPLTEENDYVTYKLTERSWYLRLDYCPRQRITMVKLYSSDNKKRKFVPAHRVLL